MVSSKDLQSSTKIRVFKGLSSRASEQAGMLLSSLFEREYAYLRLETEGVKPLVRRLRSLRTRCRTLSHRPYLTTLQDWRRKVFQSKSTVTPTWLSY
jgi:hypothetical protein